MSKFYGTLENERGCKSTRCASKAIRAAAQSYDGSLITQLFYNDLNELCVQIEIADYSTDRGHLLFCGTFQEIKNTFVNN